MSKEPAATSDNLCLEGSEFVFRLDVTKLLQITSAHGDATGWAIHRRTGISESSVYRYLSGTAQPDLNSAMRLVETYDFDIRAVIKRVPVEAAA
ncbi:helix-turn-helix domain-containing protein [Streptomyces massasporeus]|uniref:helix-turn-helix domain-containing protein n=1 Tax=Streptomyces massasporeus TaxID=67324 RepID=UPI00368F3597